MADKSSKNFALTMVIAKKRLEVVFKKTKTMTDEMSKEIQKKYSDMSKKVMIPLRDSQGQVQLDKDGNPKEEWGGGYEWLPDVDREQFSREIEALSDIEVDIDLPELVISYKGISELSADSIGHLVAGFGE
jgi:hypothetical protein